MGQKYTDGIGKNFSLVIQNPIDAKIDQHHKKLMNDVNADVQDMIDYRRPAIKHAEEAIQGYMALSTASKPGRSSFFPPTLHAIVYSRMAAESASMPEVKYKHRLPNSEPLMKFINAAKDNAEKGDGNLRPPSLFNWYLQNFDKLLFGVGFRHLTYLLQARVINIKNDKGEWKEKYCVEYDDIWDEKLNFFYTGVSRDTLPGMFGGTSAYTDKFYRREQFKAKFGNSDLYFNIDAALERFKGEFLRVRYYWNLPQDLMFVQAMDASEDMLDAVGGGIPIREDYILEYGPPDRPKKMIPITSLHGDFNFDMKVASYLDMTLMTNAGRAFTDFVSPSRNQSFWTKGNAQLVRGVIALQRALWRATADNVKASTIFFAMSQNPGVLNQLKRSDLYGVVPMKADDRTFNVKALLDRPAAFNGITEYDTAIKNLGKFALGDDWESTATQTTNQTATQAAIVQNVQRVRAAQNQSMNESGPISRHYSLLLNLIQQFYTEKTRIELMGEDTVPKGTKEKDILRGADGSPIGYMKEKQIPYDEPVSVKVGRGGKVSVTSDDKEGSKFIPGKKELLVTAEEPEIYIEPGSTFAKMKALDRMLDNEELQQLQFFAGLSYPDPQTGQPAPLIPKEGMEYRLRKHAEAHDLEPDELMGKEDDSEEDKTPPRPFGHAADKRQVQRGFPPAQPGQQQNGQQMPMQGLPQSPNLPSSVAGQGMQPNKLAGALIPGM